MARYQRTFRKDNLSGAEAAGGCAAILGLLIALFFVAGFITLVLFNLIVHDIFGGPDISYPEALAVTVGMLWVSAFFRGNISRE